MYIYISYNFTCMSRFQTHTVGSRGRPLRWHSFQKSCYPSKQHPDITLTYFCAPPKQHPELELRPGPFCQAPKQHSQPELLKQHPKPEMHPNALFQCMKSPLAPPLGKNRQDTTANRNTLWPFLVCQVYPNSNLNYAFLKPYIPPLVRVSFHVLFHPILQYRGII